MPIIQPIDPTKLDPFGQAVYYTIKDAIGGKGSQDDPFTPEQLERLQGLVDSQDDTNAKLAKAGLELVDAVLDKGVAGASGIFGTVAEIATEVEDLFTGIEDVEIADYKSKVIRADVALQALEDFKLNELKEFYTEKFSQVKSAVQEIYSEATMSNWVGQLKGAQFETVLEEVLTMVKDVLELALAVRDLVDLVDSRIRDLAAQTLSQSNPIHRVEDEGSHLTRKQT